MRNNYILIHEYKADQDNFPYSIKNRFHSTVSVLNSTVCEQDLQRLTFGNTAKSFA